MEQVGKDVRKGYSKFIGARIRDPALMLGTASYAGRRMTPLITISEGRMLAMTEQKPGDTAGPQPDSNKKKVSPIAMMRQRALVKAAERDPRMKKILEEKKKSSTKENAELVKDKIDASTPEESAKILEDPVRWFGCLIPPEVRNARGGFLTALKKLVRVANIRRDMHRIEREIQVHQNTLTKLAKPS
eukprot:CAMPEP_0114508774 /NCGR_PEP_ID=MMETSP0109-20121206/12814_1 /TAXON_ID=29199 /ORGANISM="Chlorarachnion reptans, Strain CCCM449" /LENGTH=187 /DNA_ID=CAMNT_0001687799 /DNA_START=270 /DNA_END=833 /DNA_ORIENTATION=-